MICLVALVTFAVLGIFSAKYRAYAKEAFNCVFRRITLRKCDTAFDKKVKMRVSTKLMKRNKSLGNFVFKNFEAIGWVFTILMIASLAYSAYSVYNLVVFGTCDPITDQCFFTPDAVGCSQECTTEGCDCGVVGCEEPVYAACEGDCDCIKELCG